MKSASLRFALLSTVALAASAACANIVGEFEFVSTGSTTGTGGQGTTTTATTTTTTTTTTGTMTGTGGTTTTGTGGACGTGGGAPAPAVRPRAGLPGHGPVPDDELRRQHRDLPRHGRPRWDADARRDADAGQLQDQRVHGRDADGRD